MKFKSFLGIIISFLLGVLPVFAAYNDVSLSSGASLNTTVGGSAINLSATGGTIQSVVVNAATINITLAAGSSVTLTSSDRKSLSYTSGNSIKSFECGSSASVLSISLAQSQSTETVTVTPSISTCVAPESSGGSGSSSSSTSSSSSSSSSTSSSSSSSTSSTASTPAETVAVVASAPVVSTAVVAAPVVVSVPVAVAVSSVTIDTELNPGTRSDEVMDLQKLLAKDPEIYPEGTVSGFYGPKTTAAVKKFQAKYGLPTVGRVGPATMAKLNEVLGATQVTNSDTSTTGQTAEQIQNQIQAIQSQIQGITSGSSSSGVITSEINPGTRNDEVTVLQQLLAKDPEIYPEGTVSGFYGPKTTAAVKKFQAKYGLPTVGRVGPATMAKLNEVLGGSVEKVTPSVSVPVTTTPSESTTSTTTIEDQIKAIQAQIDALLKQ